VRGGMPVRARVAARGVAADPALAEVVPGRVGRDTGGADVGAGPDVGDEIEVGAGGAHAGTVHRARAGRRAARNRPGIGEPGLILGRLRVRAGSPQKPACPGLRMADIITAEGLVKVYKGRKSEVRALDGIDLSVPEGTVLGLLGPNGAGKTTAVRILATLLKPDAGRATIAGHDVVRESDVVRHLIGLSGQYAAVDENLTASENLWLFGRLYQLSSAEARQRATELLEQFDLVDARDRVVKTYSGGMRRRLDLASALIGRPRLLILDEPTTGLDPRSRLGMWDVLRDLVRYGVTLLLTTQYLEEADELADKIVVIDHGRIIARGSADELKSQVGGERIEVVAHDRTRLAEARDILTGIGVGEAVIDEHTRKLTVPAEGGAKRLAIVIRDFDEAGIQIDDIALRRPTLDDVFLALTGHGAVEAPDGDQPTSGRAA
jgi:ABC-2 type transport system ATP-binding protein